MIQFISARLEWTLEEERESITKFHDSHVKWISSFDIEWLSYEAETLRIRRLFIFSMKKEKKTKRWRTAAWHKNEHRHQLISHCFHYVKEKRGDENKDDLRDVNVELVCTRFFRIFLGSALASAWFFPPFISLLFPPLFTLYLMILLSRGRSCALLLRGSIVFVFRSFILLSAWLSYTVCFVILVCRLAPRIFFIHNFQTIQTTFFASHSSPPPRSREADVLFNAQFPCKLTSTNKQEKSWVRDEESYYLRFRVAPCSSPFCWRRAEKAAPERTNDRRMCTRNLRKFPEFLMLLLRCVSSKNCKTYSFVFFQFNL